MKQALFRTALAALACAASVPAIATTYVGTRAVGNATAQLSFTTDGTIGALTAANYVDWSITVTQGATSVSFGKAGGFYNFAGQALVASATALTFDFSTPNHGVVFGNGAVDSFYCVTSPTTNCGGATGEMIRVAGGAVQSFTPTGIVTIARVAGVPEPASWAMLIGGLGMVGAALRRRTRTALAFG